MIYISWFSDFAQYHEDYQYDDTKIDPITYMYVSKLYLMVQ